MTELLPTPPFPDAMARTRVVAGIWVSGAFSRAAQRAFSMTSERSSGVISPQSIVTSRTPGWAATRVSTSFLIWARSGQPAMVSLTPMRTSPSADTSVPVVMPRSTMLPPSSGSITPRRSPMTSSTDGGDTRPAFARRSVPTGSILPVAAV